ncbi:methyltransferase [Arthrobacter tumbae]|uniref:class I SAM-dependent methyltransferase n=1 Tax=Arthrobacter tumbae TaxID=163874 RepID=UPI00195B0303|nr:methyltransferase [Arthrobacter tumbae]MBM7783037.1 16S rRNA (guanine1207-N2)-methyltransferase [Arthrobacter tumbae]
MPDFPFEQLRRRPDVEADNLFAYDATDRLLLDTMSEHLPVNGGVAVVGDTHGALTLGALHLGVRKVLVHQDPVTGERALNANAALLGSPGEYAFHPLGRDLFDGAQLVLLQLPRSLDALEEIAWHIAAAASADVTVLAGGRVKHMTPAMNQILSRYFGSVAAGLARQKSRVVTATGALPVGPCPFPTRAEYDVGLPRPLQIRAYGATFGGAKLDPGTRFLLQHLHNAPAAASAVDLGCGNGTIAAYLALSRPTLAVTATDTSAAAVAATRATAGANGVGGQVAVVREDGLAGRPDAGDELIVLNPPFHSGHTVHAGIALKLFAEAGRTLQPGGELWTVWNSHLQYRRALERLVGPTEQVARDRRFTVTVSTRTR